MFCSNVYFMFFLLAGSGFPESLCGKDEGQNSSQQYDYGTAVAKLRLSKTELVGDPKNSHFLFPINIFMMCECCRVSGNCEAKRPGSITNPPSSKKKYSRSNSSGDRSGGISKPLFRKPYDPTPLLECMMKVIKVSLPPIVLSASSDPFHHFFDIINKFSGEVSPAHLLAVAINQDTIELFVDAAVTTCLGFFQQYANGRLVLDEGFAKSAATESFKLRPMGALVVGATEAFAENVLITCVKNKKSQYKIDYTGLFTGLGLVAVKTTKIGQIATKSSEGRSWLSSLVKKTIEGSGSSPGSNQTPLKQLALLECVLNAASSSLSIPATKDQSNSLLELFVTAVKPCFGLFERNRDGKVGMGEGFVPEAMKQHPMGVLALESAKAIMESVSVSYDDDGTIHYNIDHTDLSIGLGSAVVESAEISQTVKIPAEGRNHIKKSISRHFWSKGPLSERIPAGLKSVVKLARDCIVKYWESAFITKTISETVKGLCPCRRMPKNMSQLFGCVLKAVATSLFGGVFKARYRGTPGCAGEPGNDMTPNVVKSFTDAATPCFAFIKRNEHGMLELDPAFLRGAVIEAIKLFPVGGLISTAIELIVENVKARKDEGGKLRYKINYAGLAIGLGVAVVEAFSFGIAYFVKDLVSSFFQV